MRKILWLMIMFGLALVACGTGGDEDGNVFGVEAEDAEMNAAIQEARETLPVFIEALQAPTETQSYYAIKVIFPFGEDGGAEHMWVDQLSYADGEFQGVLGNEPVDVTDLEYGDVVTTSAEEISDWMIVDNSQLLGGYTLHVLRNRMNEAERAQFDADFGVAIPDEPALP